MATIFSVDELRTMFQSSFSMQTWYNCLQNLFNASELKVTPEKINNQTLENGYYLGNINTVDSYRIGLFYYKITQGSVAKRKIGLRNFVRSFINPTWGEFDAALVVFDSGDLWRLSFICDIQGEATSPKRYTYVFGNQGILYRTPIERFRSLQNKGVSFENLKTAFSVEALSDEFFNEYRKQYADFIQYITGKRFVKVGSKWEEKVKGESNAVLMFAFNFDEKVIRNYIKKMMGRLTFLHFLQRKGWLCGDLNYLQNLFERSPYQDDYLDSVLEPLFFGILNTKPEQRKQVFEHYNWDLALLKEWESIPYLNGGLFERDKEDEPESKFPADYFKRLFQFFSEYNFTIDENDPNDAEVGVDPEMLGKIFENLLEDNKDKGAFYTPKEIVRYMCQESLIAYLETNTSIAKEKIRQFVLSPDENVAEIPENKKPKLLEALKEVKICDPAIGSGAFPMGLLNGLLSCREALEHLDVPRSEIKKSIIQNNIYGVDIEKGAVDIARLRFWLSIVVDEEKASPLPNLDYKIMQGNSLVESFMGVDLNNLSYKTTSKKDDTDNGLFDDEKVLLQKQVSRLLSKYYSCSDHEQKITIQQEIQVAINKQLEVQSFDPLILKILKDVNLAGNSQFFLWHTWFSEVFNRPEGKSGFDIVIGNPPYVSYYSRQAVNIENQVLESIKNDISYIKDKKKKGRFHSIQFFIYKSLNLIGKNGCCNLIIDFSFFEKPFADIRRYILSHFHIREIVTGLTAFQNVSSGQLIIAIDSLAEEFTLWKDDIIGDYQCLNLNDCLNDKECHISKPSKFANILTNIENCSCRLSEISEVRTGVNIGGVKEYFLCSDQQYPPFVSGGDNIQLYHIHYPTNLQIKRNETNFKFDKVVEKYIWDNKIGTPSIGENNDRFIRPKLIIRQSDIRITAAADLYCHYHCGYSLFTVNVPKDDLKVLCYLLGIINSKLVTFYMLNRGFIKMAPGKTPQIRVEDIKKIPIAYAHDDTKDLIAKKVLEIIEIMNSNSNKDISESDKSINSLVYQLYGLTDAEIKIIEESV